MYSLVMSPFSRDFMVSTILLVITYTCTVFTQRMVFLDGGTSILPYPDYHCVCNALATASCQVLFSKHFFS